MEIPMKRILIAIRTVLCILGLVAGHAAWAQGPYDITEQAEDTLLFTPQELDELLAPIALYPDPLLAQILPAATFIDQIDEAARYVRQYGKSARIDDQPWDVSVKAVAHYPDTLFMMDQKYDWSVSLGQAFVNQQQDVMNAIQRLSAEAAAMGNLVSTPEQQVINEADAISIVPAYSEVMYVPQYDPQVVYVEPPDPSFGFITFGIGFTIGAWLNRDCDWHGHRVYYHGWKGAGWISRARPHIIDRRNIYINNKYTAININRRVMQHNTERFRDVIRSNIQNRRVHNGITTPQRQELPTHDRGTAKTTPGRPVTQMPGPNIQPLRPAPQAARPPQRPGNIDVYRGRNTQAAPSSNYGRYGSSNEIKTYRERGQASRENMRQSQQQPARAERPKSAPQPTPEQRSAPAKHRE
jgi:hypothetical protein